jgi:hypothetical protein
MPLRGTIRRRNAILSAVKAIFQKKTHQFGIELPTSIDHARELDRVNENNLWMEALQKEMFNIGIALPEWIHLDVVGRLTPSKDGN